MFFMPVIGGLTSRDENDSAIQKTKGSGFAEYKPIGCYLVINICRCYLVIQN